MSRARAQALVFDLDGTLVDSREDLATAVNRTRADFGLPPLALAAVVGMVGQGARTLVRRALGGEPAPELLERALAGFLAHYEPICVERTRPYPGISGLLGELARRLPLALLTNKPERPTRVILERFGWSRHFATVIAGDSLPARKPAPDGLLALAARFGLPPAGLLMIGDSRIDAETAAAAGAPFLLVEWGFAGESERAGIAAGDRARDPEALRVLLVRRTAPDGGS